MNKLVQQGIRAAAVAALAAAASIGGGVASAAEVPAASHVQEDQPGSEGPAVVLHRPGVAPDPDAGAMTIQSPGYAARLSITFRLGGQGTYTNVHFSTSEPGSAAGCPITTLPGLPVGARSLDCPVKAATLAPGEKRTYTVTMTGERDGKPFSVSDTTVIWAPEVSIAVLRDGQDITGTNAQVTLGSTMQLVVTNRSGTPMTDLSDFVDEGPMCTIPSLPANGTASCSFRFGDDAMGRSLFLHGPLEMWGLHATAGGAHGFIRTPRTMLTLVDVITEGGTPSTGGTTTPPVTTTTTPAADDATVAPTDGVPAAGGDGEPPLAETGVPVGAALAGGLGLLSLGGASMLLARRRS